MSTHRYAHALDGIRALLVTVVVAYHLGVPHTVGGLFSLSTFFTLSGYLITSLLLDEWRRTGTIALRQFWLRRFRRLLPAVFLLLPTVLAAAAISRAPRLAAMTRQAIATLLYVANWNAIRQGDNYFDNFDGPGAFDHLWSLSVEEQFYFAWPLIVVGLLALGKRLHAAPPVVGEPLSFRHRAPLALGTALLTAASTWAIIHLYHPADVNHTRAYEGTDARAAAILSGAFIAVLLPLAKIEHIAGWRRYLLEALGLLGAAALTLAFIFYTFESPFLYRGGELLIGACASAFVMAAAHPQSPVLGRVFGLAPLRWLGERSYGIYLWHMPVIVLTPRQVLEGHPVARGALQIAIVVTLTALSYTLLEDPIRRRGLAVFRSGPESDPVAGARFRMAVVALAGAAVGGLSTLQLAVSRPVDELALLRTAIEGGVPGEGSTPPGAAPAAAPDMPSEAPPTGGPDAAGAPSPAASAGATEAPAAGELRTSCRELVHIGDSTSVGLVMPFLVPRVEERLASRYRSVGVQIFYQEIEGARAIFEHLPNGRSGLSLVRQYRGSPFKGCFVIALGTNDPANMKGNFDLLTERIDTMMKVIDGAPAMWTTSKTLLATGLYSNENMLVWNRAVEAACARYPNMRVYDYAREVEDAWFLQDRVHFNGGGCRERAARMARAVARAFPKDGPSPPGCMVSGAP